MRTRLATLAAVVTLLSAASLAGCAAPEASSDDGAEASQDAVTTQVLKPSTEIRIGDRTLGAPAKIAAIVKAMRFGADLPDGARPRCMMDRQLTFLDAKGAILGVAQYSGSCGFVELKGGKRQHLTVDPAKIDAVLGQSPAVGDLLVGADKIVSFPDNEEISRPDEMAIVVAALDLDELPAPLAPSSCAPPAQPGGYRFHRAGKVVAVVEPQFDCEISSGVLPGRLLDGAGVALGYVKLDYNKAMVATGGTGSSSGGR